MISRAHALVVSLLLGLGAAAGGYAVVSTAKLGEGATKPEVATAAALAKQAKRLRQWKASLDEALASKPPKLPRVPRFAHVALVDPPAPLQLPVVGAVSRPATRPAETALASVTVTRVVKRRVRAAPDGRAPLGDAESEPREEDAVTVARSRPGRPASVPETPAPDSAAPEPGPTATHPITRETASGAPVPEATPAVAVAAPVPPVAGEREHEREEAPTGNDGSQTLSWDAVETQCEALKRAAEKQGEAARQAAEQQCEALKQAAEKQG